MGTWALLDTDEGAGSQATVLEHRRQFAALCHEMLILKNHIDAVLAAMDAGGGSNELVGTLSGTSEEREVPFPGSPPGALPVVKADWQAISTDLHTLQTNLNVVLDATLLDQLGGLVGPTAGI